MRRGCCARTVASSASSTRSAHTRAPICSSTFGRAVDHPPTFSRVLGACCAKKRFDATGEAPLIHEVIRASARHGQAVEPLAALGVIEAVQHLIGGLQPHADDTTCRGSSTSRSPSSTGCCFLMFAESRGLVPNWHPIYRESYTIESLRERVERPGTSAGLWEALQAIARLAHSGMPAGSLVVPPFNGRLFSPARAPIAESCAVDDEVARGALLALSTTTPSDERRSAAPTRRIDYRDLGVEQLGAVYESVLDYEPAFAEPGS